MSFGTAGVIISYAISPEPARNLTRQVNACGPIGMWMHDNFEKNENIHVLWNRYLKTGRNNGEFFLIMNPDVRPELGWYDEMMNIMVRDPRIAAVGPSTDHCYNEQANRHPALMKLAQGSWVPNVLIPGFCALYRTEALKQIGGWREDFKFYGGDLDLVYRLQLAGWLSAWAVGAFVWHEWGGSARKLGDEAYAELRRVGNEQLTTAIQSYEGTTGIWMAKPGGGVFYAGEDGTIQSQGQEDAGREPGEREATLEEAAGTLRGDRLGEDAQESQEKEGLTPS